MGGIEGGEDVEVEEGEEGRYWAGMTDLIVQEYARDDIFWVADVVQQAARLSTCVFNTAPATALKRSSPRGPGALGSSRVRMSFQPGVLGLKADGDGKCR